MINKTFKKTILLIALTLLLIGIVSATTTKTTTTTNTATITTTNTNTLTNTATNTINQEDNKEIKKQNMINKTTKNAAKTININNPQTLYDTLQSNEYDTLTLNIKSNIKLTEAPELNQAITKLTINGNGKTVSGSKKYEFLNIPSDTTVNIKNLNIINCNSDYGGSINNYGKLTITNSNLNYNKANVSGGAIYNSGTLIIKDSKLHSNKANYGGSLINFGKLTITNTKIYSNTAIEGGAIDNEETITISNSLINNNKAQNGGALYNSGTLTITDSKFNNNNVSKYGGAISEQTYETNHIIKISAKFTNNTAPRGGAIYIGNQTKTIKINSNFTKNHATYGGAIYNNANKAIITGNFNYNYASNKYNLVYNKGTNCKISVTPSKYKFSKYGGAIYNKANNVQINIKSAQKTKIEQLKTKITINNIATVNKGNTITITGKFTDETGNILKNSQLTLNINGKKYTTKTNNQGKYTYKYKTTKTGTNKITISYAGNTNYIKSSVQKSFSVTNKYKVITLPITKDPYTKFINGDPLWTGYVTYYGQYDPGVYVEIDERGLDYSPVNKLVKVKFYFKNSRGNIITRTVTPKYKTVAETSLISGYTPFKAEITYCKMTETERYNHWYGY